jgi:hypothetical protein
VPWDCLSSDSDESSDDGGDKGTGVVPALIDRGLEANTELKQLMAGIVETVTCLLRLSMAVRNPAPHDQFMKSMNIDTSFYEEHDIKHVEEKFPDADNFLVTRLGRAISRRRQYLKYREAHHKKLAYGIDKEQGDSHTEAARQSTVASSLPSALKEVDHIDLTEDSGSESGVSMASSVTSANGTVKLRPPPLPREAQDGNPFECPLCFMIVSIRGTRSWQ